MKTLPTFKEVCGMPVAQRLAFIDSLTREDREQILATAPEYLLSMTEDELLDHVDRLLAEIKADLDNININDEL